MAEVTRTQALPPPFIETLGKTFGEQLGRLTPTAIDTGKFAPSVAPQIGGGFTQAAQQAAATQAGLGTLTFDPSGAVSGMGAGTGISGYQPYLTGAAGLTGPMTGQQLADYESPYKTEVLGALETDMASRRAQQQNAMAAQALQSGAFGGGRFGAQTAVADTEYNKALTQMQAQVRQQMFGQAQQARQQDFGNLQGLAQLQPQLAGQQIGQLGQMGQAGLGYRQAITDAEAQAKKVEAYEPYQRTGFFGEQLTGLMGGYPGGSRMQITPTASPLQQGLMTGLGGAAAYQGIKGMFG